MDLCVLFFLESDRGGCAILVALRQCDQLRVLERFVPQRLPCFLRRFALECPLVARLVIDQELAFQFAFRMSGARGCVSLEVVLDVDLAAATLANIRSHSLLEHVRDEAAEELVLSLFLLDFEDELVPEIFSLFTDLLVAEISRSLLGVLDE